MTLTIFTQPEELDSVIANGESGQFFRSIIQIIIDGHFEVDDVSTRFTDKMVVWLHVGFEPVECTAKMDLFYQALFDEGGKVSIYRS